MPAVEVMVMPVTGFRFEWRHDGWWRCLAPGELDDVRAGVQTEPAWTRWTGTPSITLRGCDHSPTPGQRRVGFGDVPPGADVRVELEDGTIPEVTRLGGLSIAEWDAVPRAVTVQVGAEQLELRVPDPTRHLQPRPPADPDGGWYGSRPRQR